MNSESSYLRIDQGVDSGKIVEVLPAGVRLGRSSKNDVKIDDPKMSRHHCRLYHKPDGGLVVADLGSANQTLLNDAPVQETQVQINDRIQLGDTVLCVIQVSGSAAPANIDLGLAPAPRAGSQRNMRRPLLLGLAVAVILIAVGIWLPKLLPHESPSEIPITDVPKETPQFVEIHYEKVQAGADKIFRYAFALTPDKRLEIQIDDTGSVHIDEAANVTDVLVSDLAEYILESGFFELEESNEGIARASEYEAWTISVTVNRRTHRVHVANRLEPRLFRDVREKLEDFGHVELGLWAVEYPPEKLIEMASNAFLDGQKFYDTREIKYGNLANAIKSFKMARFYLKTIDPKPEFYRSMMQDMLPTCEQALEEQYVHRNFLATRASNLREWSQAADELRIVLELIPNREDDRHIEARKLLLEVEERLRSER